MVEYIGEGDFLPSLLFVEAVALEIFDQRGKGLSGDLAGLLLIWFVLPHFYFGIAGIVEHI
jgi:hypothetical protein